MEVFQSTPSARRATRYTDGHYTAGILFQSTPSARRATMPQQPELIYNMISIHALREEGDTTLPACPRTSSDFNPRPPRGGRRSRTPRSTPTVYFNPRPPRGGRQPCMVEGKFPQRISIHALREEGDRWQGYQATAYKIFQSTPSSRRATGQPEHAPMRSDNFNPRPPRGERLFRQGIPATSIQFQSTPSSRRAT